MAEMATTDTASLSNSSDVKNINNFSINSLALAKELIKSFEGLSLKAYFCPAKKKTIGYGHVCLESERIEGQITSQQAEILLEQDMLKACRSLRRHCPTPITLQQEAALSSFIFNCGSGAFQASSLRQKLLRGEYSLAANEFPKWAYANGVKLPGLVRRRLAERNLFLADN